MVNRRVGRRGRRRQAPRIDNGRAPLANRWQEHVFIPGIVVDQCLDALTADRCETVVRVHSRAMVAPDHQFLNLAHGLSGFCSELGQGAVVIEPQHSREVLLWQIWGRLHGDIRIRIGGVSYHQDLDGSLGYGIQGAALGGKDLGIGREQVLALHSWAAWAGANQQANVDVFKCGHWIAVGGHAGQEREGAVV